MRAERFVKGVIAGFVATAVIAILLALQAETGFMPQQDMIGMLTEIMGSSSRLVGWSMHFLLGSVVWGGLFSWLDPYLPGEQRWLKGLAFGVGAWLLMMLIVMPMTGNGLFAIIAGPKMQFMSLVLHLVYGGVLGLVYGAERPSIEHRAPPVRHKA